MLISHLVSRDSHSKIVFSETIRTSALPSKKEFQLDMRYIECMQYNTHVFMTAGTNFVYYARVKSS